MGQLRVSVLACKGVPGLVTGTKGPELKETPLGETLNEEVRGNVVDSEKGGEISLGRDWLKELCPRTE